MTAYLPTLLLASATALVCVVVVVAVCLVWRRPS